MVDDPIMLESQIASLSTRRCDLEARIAGKLAEIASLRQAMSGISEALYALTERRRRAADGSEAAR